MSRQSQQPAHSTVAVKHLCDSIQRGSAPVYLADGDEPTAWVVGQSCQRPGGGFDGQRMRAHVGPVPAKGRIRGQEVVINSTGTGTLGRVALVPMLPPDRPVFADTHVTVLAIDRQRCDPRFIAYTLGLRAFARFADEALSVGATKQRELSVTAIATHRIHCPAAETQRKIADLLDRECERIGVAQKHLDRLAIAAEEPALVLAERAWADHPPGRIGYAFEVQLGKMLYEDRIDHATARPYLRNANVHWDRFALDDVKVMNFEGAEAALFALRPGDLLVCEGGEPGRSAVWEGQIAPCYFQKALNRVRPHGLASTRWVMWCLRVLGHGRGFGGDGPGRFTHLTAEQLRGTRIPLPAPEVQHRLAAEIDDAARGGRRLASVAATTRARLTEYRDALITEAVTGRLELATSDGELTDRLDAAVDGAHR